MEQPMSDDALSPDVKLCECGCGEPAPIAKETKKRLGYVKGQPLRFIRGHSGRVTPPPRKKPKLFVRQGQRFGRGVVIDPDVRFRQPSGREVRGARLLCNDGVEYLARIEALVGALAATPHGVLSCGCLNAENRLATMARAAEARRGKRSIGFIDRTGQQYGLLTVIQFSGTQERRGRMATFWLCRCKCGREKTVAGANLASGATQSCGNHPKALVLPPGQSGRNAVLKTYKGHARRRGLAWELDDEDFDWLTSQDCFYCGAPPSNVHTLQSGRNPFVYSGIDRMDNDLPYTPGNVCPACAQCNRAKMNMPYGEWLAWLARITEYLWFHPEIMPSLALRAAGQKPALRVVREDTA